jgi:hypothetical protein
MTFAELIFVLHIAILYDCLSTSHNEIYIRLANLCVQFTLCVYNEVQCHSRSSSDKCCSLIMFPMLIKDLNTEWNLIVPFKHLSISHPHFQ